ncbi:MAG: amidohydrolase family protein [Fibrobacter sp.]|nr:amidohydrolase family protein [Fibrobacter sp.]
MSQVPEETLRLSMRLEIRELIAQGVTTILDSSRLGLSLPVLNEESIRGYVISEIHPDDTTPEPDFLRSKLNSGKNLFHGFGPYSIFSLSPQSQKSLIEHTTQNKLLWAAHIAESSEELQAFSEKTGELYSHVTQNKEWPFDICAGSIKYALSQNLIPDNGICFHCNYITGDELQELASKNVSVVLCYQYSQEMGHKPFPLEIALNRNIPICLGTEGVAAHGFMSLFDELFAIKKAYPYIPAEQMINWVTQNAANALNAGTVLGSLTEGKFADMIALQIRHDPNENILDELIMSDPEIIMVMINGEEVIVNF